MSPATRLHLVAVLIITVRNNNMRRSGFHLDAGSSSQLKCVCRLCTRAGKDPSHQWLTTTSAGPTSWCGVVGKSTNLQLPASAHRGLITVSTTSLVVKSFSNPKWSLCNVQARISVSFLWLQPVVHHTGRSNCIT